ncbi:Uncharacterised protein [Yersinia frederiksenii]|nr:Uncharacterised protein [Yersinia frederiksenii]
MVFGFGWYSFGDHLSSATSTEQEGEPARFASMRKRGDSKEVTRL